MMLQKVNIPSRSQQRLIAAAEVFAQDANEEHVNDHNDHVDINMFAFMLRWLRATQGEN